MIDPSGIKPNIDKLIVKEVKPGVYTIENAYEGVHEDFTTSKDIVELSTVEEQSDSRKRSIEDWSAEFGFEERTTVTIEELDTNTTTEEDTTTRFKNQ